LELLRELHRLGNLLSDRTCRLPRVLICSAMDENPKTDGMLPSKADQVDDVDSLEINEDYLKVSNQILGNEIHLSMGV